MKKEPNHNHLNSILKNLPDPLFIVSQSGVYLDIFGGSDDRYYHDGSDLVGLSVFDIMDKEKADWFYQQIQTSLKINGLLVIEYTLSNLEIDGLEEKNGPLSAIYFEAKLLPLPNLYNGEKAVLWEARNITKRHKLEQQLRELSEKDAMTGLYNRRKLTQALDKEFLLCSGSFSLIMYDIDCLKNINDNYGHDIGDNVICLISNVIKKLIRKKDILCRFGGDEFIVLMKETTYIEAELFAQKITMAIRGADFESCSYPSTPTISIGVTQAQSNEVHSASILKRVDQALYKAKNNGRNQTVVL